MGSLLRKVCLSPKWSLFISLWSTSFLSSCALFPLSHCSCILLGQGTGWFQMQNPSPLHFCVDGSSVGWSACHTIDLLKVQVQRPIPYDCHNLVLWQHQKQEMLKSGAFPELGRNLAFGLINYSFVSSNLWVYWQGTSLCLAAVFPLLRSTRLLSINRVVYQDGDTICQCLSLLLMS